MATAEEMLKQALDDTIEAIEDAAKVEIGGDNVDADVLEAARAHWRARYMPTFKKAIADGRIWKDDKAAVLERAAEVGRLATYIAVMVAIIEELVRGGVGKKPGQDISIRDAAKPRIDRVVAECGALFIDCDQKVVVPTWDWCPRPKANALGECMELLLARFVSEYGTTDGVVQVRAALKPQ